MRLAVPALIALILIPYSGHAQQQRAALSSPSGAIENSAPASNRIAFRVIRDGVEIGSHELTFRRDGERLTVDIAIDLNVTFLGLSLYRYRHRGSETWEGDRLIALQTTTDNNGEAHQVRGRASENGILVAADGQERLFPADAVPSSHWNRSWVAGRPLINSQNGEPIRFSASGRGLEPVETPSGVVAAQHFTIAGDLRKEIWFDEAGHWVKTSFAAPDGSTISYALK